MVAQINNMKGCEIKAEKTLKSVGTAYSCQVMMEGEKVVWEATVVEGR